MQGSRVALLGLVVAGPAWAVPMQFVQQGRLLDGAGVPLTGAHTVTFALYPQVTGGSAVWAESHTVQVDGGFYSVVLGEDQLLDAELFAAGDPLYLQLVVDGGAPLPSRVPLLTVPFAIRAGSAGSVDPGSAVDVTELSVGGHPVIGGDGTYAGDVPWGVIVGVPSDLTDGDADTLATLTCAAGQILRYDSGAFACANASDHAHDASAIATGTIAVGRLPVGSGTGQVAPGIHSHTVADLPVGSGAGQVAAGNHTHTTAELPVGSGAGQVAPGVHTHAGADIVSGTVPVGRLPIGTTAGTVAAGNHGHTAAEVGAVPAGGGVLVGTTPTCEPAAEGTLRWVKAAKRLELCDGANWVVLHSLSTPQDCAELQRLTPYVQSGMYDVDPDGDGTPTRVYCDMDYEGGGWIRLLTFDAAADGTAFATHAALWDAVGSQMGLFSCPGSGVVSYANVDTPPYPTQFYTMDLAGFPSSREVRFRHADAAVSWDGALFAQVEYADNAVDRRIYNDHACGIPNGDCNGSESNATYDDTITWNDQQKAMKTFSWGVKTYQGGCGDYHQISAYALYIR